MGLMLAPIENTPYVGGNRPGFLSVSSGGTQQLVKSNLSAVAPPTSLDDSSAGYAVGSIWIDVTNDYTYICVDASVGAAVWNGVPKHSLGRYTLGAPVVAGGLSDEIRLVAATTATYPNTAHSYGAFFEANADTPSVVRSHYDAVGMFAIGRTLAGNTTVWPGTSYVMGGSFSGSHNGTGAIASIYGVSALAGNRNVGTATDVVGLEALSILAGGGTTVNNYGVRVKSAQNLSGTLQNNYGVYIEDQSAVGSVSTFNLYSAGANSNNYFAGKVGIGTTTPATVAGIALAGRSILNITGTGEIGSLAIQGTQAELSLVDTDANANEKWFYVNTSAGVTTLYALDSSSAIYQTFLSCKHSSGNVGIGTTSPGSKLTVDSGDIAFTTAGQYGLRWPGGSRLYEQTTAAGGAERMLYAPNGDRLEILSEDLGSFVAGFHGPLSALASSVRLYGAVGIGNVAGYAQSGTLPTNGLVVAGNVGIGTTSPGSALTVAGYISTSGGLKLVDTYDMMTNPSAGELSIGNNAAWTKVNVPYGNVGVGTNNPQAKLDNNGSLKTVTAHFPVETSNAPTGTTQAVNWTTNNKQKLDVSGASGDVSVTFSSPPPGVTNLILKVVQGGTARDITWPAAVTWLGTEPVWNADTSKTRIVAIYYDGTTYWATASPTNT